MSILSDNLKKARLAAGFPNQEKPAKLLGIKRSTFASYEEGRAKPPITLLPKIVDVYSIIDWRSFLADPHWDPAHQRPPSSLTALQQRFDGLRGKIKSLAEDC